MKPSEKHPSEIGDTRVNQKAIGARLRELFDEVVNEPVPDEFLDLLRQADERRPTLDATAHETPAQDVGGSDVKR